MGKRYGVWDDLWNIQRRTTFILDQQGKVRWMEAGSLCIDPSRTLDALSGLARER